MTKSIYSSAEPVSGQSKVLGFGDLFSLWFSLGIGLAVLQSGALLAAGLGMSGSLLAIVVGVGLGAILLALVGNIGSHTGRASMSSLGLVFGRRGASTVAILNLVQLIGWGAFEVVVMRDGASLLAGRAWGNESWLASPTLWTFVFGLLATALAISGPLSFVRLFLRRWGIWLLLLACAWFSWALFTQADLPALWQRAGDGSLSFSAGCDITISMALSWLPLVSDYTRFSRPGGRSLGGTAIGFFIGSVWMMALGAAWTLAFTTGDDSQALLLALSGAAMGIPLLLVLIDETENAFADIHSAAVSSGFLVPVRIEILALGIGLLSTLIAWAVPLSRYENFLLLIGSVFAPLFSVVLVCWWGLGYRQQLGRNQQGLALVSWLAGVATYHTVLHLLPTWSATFSAMAVSGILMLMGARIIVPVAAKN